MTVAETTIRTTRSPGFRVLDVDADTSRIDTVHQDHTTVHFATLEVVIAGLPVKAQVGPFGHDAAAHTGLFFLALEHGLELEDRR